MDNFQSVLGRAAGGALCNVLDAYGSAAPFLTAISLIEPTPIGEVAAVTSGLAALAARSGCTWDTQGQAPPSEQTFTGCAKAATGRFRMKFTNLSSGAAGTAFEYVEIVDTYIRDGEGADTAQYQGFRYIPDYGQPPEEYDSLDIAVYGNYNGEPVGGATCETPAPPGTPLPPAPYEYTDAETGCSLTVNFKGWGLVAGGNADAVWQIEPYAQQLRADGGVIGGCNFDPVIYVGDGGDGGGGGDNPPYAPIPPGFDPDTGWQDLAREIVAGTVGAIIAQQLQNLFSAPYLGTTYRLVSVCETDSSGEPISEAVEEIIPELPINDAILTRLDALVPLLQGQKDFKQPVCPPTKLEGDFRTISFRSEEVSPNGKSCLRKRLRYRSISGIGLGELIDYWKDFSFSAGPVVVKHRGSSWGTITVWASDVAEGKRVILHAAGEAGIDANQTGRWEVSGSSSSRLGMPGTMKIDTTGGYYWITNRDGSSQRPIVGKT